MGNRASLSEEQNQAVDIATRLAVHVEKGDYGQRTGQELDDDVQQRMRKKVRTIARMARMFKTLRQENETVIRLKGVCPGHKLAPGLLLAGKERLNSELEVYSYAQGIDAVNEKRPEGIEKNATDFKDEDAEDSENGGKPDS